MSFEKIQERNNQMVKLFNCGNTTNRIAKDFNMSRQNVQKILKNILGDKYSQEVNKRNDTRNKRAQKIKNTFKKSMSVKDTAEKFGVSESAVTQIIQNMPEYLEIKEKKKAKSKKKRENKINSEKNEEVSLMAGLKAQNEVNIRMMSRKGKLLDDSIIKLCINEYSIKKGKRMIFNEGQAGKRPFDLPAYFRIS